MRKISGVIFLIGISFGMLHAQPVSSLKEVSRVLETKSEKAVISAVKKQLPTAGKVLEPLDNGRIEQLVKRGKEKMVIQRALALAHERQAPIAFILQGREVNRPLLTQTVENIFEVMNRWDRQSIVGMNAWFMVLVYKIRDKYKWTSKVIARLEDELNIAQQNADKVFCQRYPQFKETKEQIPEYRELLAESVAQQLTDNFLPMLNPVDQMRFLKILMQSVLDGPVRPVEINIAVLEKDLNIGLKFLGPIMEDITFYGPLKNALEECARRAAEEAAANNIYSLPQLRSLLISHMEHYGRFIIPEKSKKDWAKLITFYKEGAQMPYYPESWFLQ